MTSSYSHEWADHSGAPEVQLPESQPLVLTRNFVWVVLGCLACLSTVPVLIAWLVSIVIR